MCTQTPPVLRIVAFLDIGFFMTPRALIFTWFTENMTCLIERL